jgi:hypothetical protein
MAEIRPVAPDSPAVEKARRKLQDRLDSQEIDSAKIQQATEAIRRQRDRNRERVPLSKNVYHPLEEPASPKIKAMMEKLRCEGV